MKSAICLLEISPSTGILHVNPYDDGKITIHDCRIAKYPPAEPVMLPVVVISSPYIEEFYPVILESLTGSLVNCTVNPRVSWTFPRLMLLTEGDSVYGLRSHVMTCVHHLQQLPRGYDSFIDPTFLTLLLVDCLHFVITSSLGETSWNRIISHDNHLRLSFEL